jgi:hypothetical protein
MKHLLYFLITFSILNSTFSIAATIQLPATGQNKCYDPTGSTTSEIPCAGTGQDGAVQAGVAWPNPRFSVSGACVTDTLTGLMWSQNANLANGTRTWQGALDWVVTLNNGGGLCGYSDWRLPSRRDLYSLIDLQNIYPALPTVRPFSNVVNSNYWSSSSFVPNTNVAWLVGMDRGFVDNNSKGSNGYVWPVRGGQ